VGGQQRGPARLPSLYGSQNPQKNVQQISYNHQCTVYVPTLNKTNIADCRINEIGSSDVMQKKYTEKIDWHTIHVSSRRSKFDFSILLGLN